MKRLQKQKKTRFFFVRIDRRRLRFYWTIKSAAERICSSGLYVVAGAKEIGLYGGLGYGALERAAYRRLKKKS